MACHPQPQRQFETASKEVEVHWLLWLGVVVMLVAVSVTLLRSHPRTRRPGYRLTFVSGVFYADVSVWHFIEHANGNDPQLAQGFWHAGAARRLAGSRFIKPGRIEE